MRRIPRALWHVFMGGKNRNAPMTRPPATEATQPSVRHNASSPGKVYMDKDGRIKELHEIDLDEFADDVDALDQD